MEIRLAKLRKFLQKNGVEAVLINSLENISYFSGFRGDDSFVLVTPRCAVILTDFRYVEQARRQSSCCEVIEYKKSLFDAVAAVYEKERIQTAGFEGDAYSYNQYTKLAAAFPAVYKPLDLTPLRMVKDEAELKKLKQAVAISDAAFRHVLTILRAGLTEVAVAAELENVMRRLGSERPAFATIVASGARGSLPHGTATQKPIACGDFVTMDFGAVYEGYHSDMTRTVCIGKANAKQREIYATVLEAQLLGTKTIRAGKSCKDVDAAVRQYLASAGYGKYFGHGLGHGVGLAIHELPHLSPKSAADALLTRNMTVTIEPGVYLPKWGGVRIEDTVAVTENGCEILTASDKQLLEIENADRE